MLLVHMGLVNLHIFYFKNTFQYILEHHSLSARLDWILLCVLAFYWTPMNQAAGVSGTYVQKVGEIKINSPGMYTDEQGTDFSNDFQISLSTLPNTTPNYFSPDF